MKMSDLYFMPCTEVHARMGLGKVLEMVTLASPSAFPCLDAWSFKNEHQAHQPRWDCVKYWGRGSMSGTSKSRSSEFRGFAVAPSLHRGRQRLPIIFAAGSREQISINHPRLFKMEKNTRNACIKRRFTVVKMEILACSAS